MQIEYVPRKFSPASLRVITQAIAICEAYAAQGLDLTLRQLYYQFVSRDLIPNRQSEYKKLGSIINDARLAGLLDWDFIVDRTRSLRSVSTWRSPDQIVRAAADSFAVDKWRAQPVRPEVWIEKDALVGVIEQPCAAEQVGYFSCRGYTSQSELWAAAQRLGTYLRRGQDVTVIHLGDHDPSGIDMTRDIEDRLRLFIRKDNTSALRDAHRSDISDFWAAHGDINTVEEARETYPEDYRALMDSIDATSDGFGSLRINRIALNMDQVDQYEPPPNPAKLTDSRAQGYIETHGYESWELDALEPTVLRDLITEAITEDRDENLWDAALEREETQRQTLVDAADQWPQVADFVAGRA